MKKKTLLLLALGLAATVQAQNAPAANPAQPADKPVAAKPAPAPVPAPAVQPAPAAQPEAAPAPAPAATETAAAPADSAATPEPVAAADSAATAPQEVAPADSAAAPADSAVAQAAEPVEKATPADSAAAAPEQVAVADTTAETPKDSVVAAPVVADTLKKDTVNVAEAKKEPANKLGDILHGNAYNSVGNEAAASTIGGNVGFPHFMHGSKLVYFDVTQQQGVVAFGDSWTYFLSFDNNEDMGLLTAGIAFGKFGVSIDYSLGKSWRYTDHADNTSETERDTKAGSMVGANASMNFGSFDVLVSGHYTTPDTSHFLSLPNSEVDRDSWGADGYVGVSYSGDEYYWTLGVLGVRNSFKTKTTSSEIKNIGGKNYLETTKITLTDTLSNFTVVPAFTLGSAVLSSKNANVYLGLNTMVPVVMYDEIDSLCDKHNEIALIMTPNILGEVQLSKYFMAFGGASYDWKVADYTDRELGNEKSKEIATNPNATTVELGARFDYGPAAIEMAFTKTFLENPFGAQSKATSIVTSLGAFIYF